MSWAEVKKINSDLSTPLNILATIQHIDMVGDKYVGYGDIKGTVSILETDAVYAHEIAKEILIDLVLANAELLTAVVASPMAINKCLRDGYASSRITGETQVKDYCESILSASTGVGEWLAFLADSDNATLKACADMTAVVASSTAMTAVVASSTAMTAVIASETAMTAVIASETAMNAIVASSTAMTAVANSSTAMTAILNSETAMTAVFNSWIAKGEILKVNSAMTVLMTNATSRDWLIANKSEKYTIGLFEWKLQTTKKGLCLRFKHPTSGGADPKIAQADGTKERSGGTTWVDVNQMYIGLKQYGNCTCDFVLMEQ